MRLAALAVACSLTATTPAGAYYDASAGKPASKALPPYCQMGECFVQTVEAVDPVLFGSSAVLFRVESQNWHGDFNPKSLRRTGDSVSYVLCSKKTPATVDEVGPSRFSVVFLAPNDGSTYYHSNSTSLSLYFSVCHARTFGTTLFDQGPSFAASLGYTVHAREDQPTVDSLEKVMELAR